MGPSGSGKSTLMHIMAGLDAPTQGRAWIGDTEITGLSDLELTILRRRRVGFVFQAFNLVPTLDAIANITLPFDLDGRRPSALERARIDGLVETLGLADRLRHRPHQLSGGQQQRVAIARALATAPDLVFADEPTGNLDSRSGREVLGLLAAASRDHGQSIAMVTHDPIAASHADRVIFLGDGRIVADKPRQTAEEISAYMLASELGAEPVDAAELEVRGMTAGMHRRASTMPTRIRAGRAAASVRLSWLRERGMGASVLVAAISTAFGVVLLSATAYIGAMLRADPYIGGSGTLAFVLSFMTFLLVGVAVYVASIVTANTFATVVAGRTRRIALLRLIGASARSQRAEIARQGLVVGVIGAVLGLVGGLALAGGGVVAGGTDAGARRHPVRPRAAGAAAARGRRRTHHVGGGLGRIAPRADRDAAAGARRVGRGVPRRRRAPHRAERRGPRALHRRRGAARAGDPRRARHPAGRRGRVRRRHPLVHRTGARRHARDAARAAARRSALRSLGDRAPGRRERAAVSRAVEPDGDRRRDGRDARDDVRGRDRVDEGRHHGRQRRRAARARWERSSTRSRRS